MISFLYLICFAALVALVFAVIHTGELREKVLYGVKVFLQFVGISLLLAWILYFLPF